MKQKLLLLICFLGFIFFFQSCSWQNLFSVYNLSNKPILMEYSFFQNQRGFPLFEAPVFHKLENGQIDWYKTALVDFKESYKYDTLAEVANVRYKFHLPPKCVVIIGRLNNSHYESVDQNFINDRYFNLTELKIFGEKEEQIITKANFDNYFKVVRGDIVYKLD